ncbi:MAG: glycosyltransferase [Deltaproteobacteria bacterium]|nr:glycosyltransferase [Deltaproteobacteria bacterium]
MIRKHMTQKADYWIFETEVLRKRAIELCGFPEDRISVVRMAHSKLVSKDRVDISQSEFFDKRIPKAYRILYLTGAHPNKRLHLLPDIAKEMVRAGFNDFCFVTTMDEETMYARRIIDEFVDKGLNAHLVNLGTVHSEYVSTVIEVCDAMCIFSVLESFSNNFVEAWRMEKPLVTTDADWSRDSCGNAALYVDPAKTAQTASELISLARNELKQFRYTEEGKIQLARYHTPESKLNAYLDVILRAKQLGPLSSKLRKKIHWS